MAARWTAALVMLRRQSTRPGREDSGKTIQQEMAEQLDLFSLCSPGERMDLVVDDLPGHAAGAGLTGDAIREAVEGRLRRARLLDPNAEPLLHVEIVLGEPEEEHIPFYSVQVRYLRDLVAERLRLAALAETWSAGGAGQGDAASFLDHLGIARSTRSSPSTAASRPAKRAWTPPSPAPLPPIPNPKPDPESAVRLASRARQAVQRHGRPTGNADRSGQEVSSTGHLSTRSPCLVRAM